MYINREIGWTNIIVQFHWYPQFQYQKENHPAANHSTGFTGTAVIWALLVLFYFVPQNLTSFAVAPSASLYLWPVNHPLYQPLSLLITIISQTKTGLDNLNHSVNSWTPFLWDLTLYFGQYFGSISKHCFVYSVKNIIIMIRIAMDCYAGQTTRPTPSSIYLRSL